jgi:DNA-binding transcriptional MerR regulator
MRIGELSARTSVPVKTLRFWEDQGLLPEPLRTASGYRDYDPDMAARVAFVRHAQAAGFRLDKIRQILEISDAGEPTCKHVAQLIEARLADVEARIAELDATRRHLRGLDRRAAEQDPAACDGYCSIIASRSDLAPPVYGVALATSPRGTPAPRPRRR